jgi:hypothetical protein
MHTLGRSFDQVAALCAVMVALRRIGFLIMPLRWWSRRRFARRTAPSGSARVPDKTVKIKLWFDAVFK